MKCPKCGEECNSGVWFCDACGCNLKDFIKDHAGGSKLYSGEEQNYFEYQELQSDHDGKRTKEKKKKTKGSFVNVILTVSLLAIVVLVGIFVYQAVHKPDYEKQLDKVIALVNEHSANLQEYGENIFPEKIWKEFVELVNTQYVEEGRNPDDEWREANIQMKAVIDELESAYGTDYKYEVEIKNERKLGKDELSDIEEFYVQLSQLVNAFGKSGEALKDAGMMKSYEKYQTLIKALSEVKCKEGYELEVTYRLDQDGEESESTETLYMVLVDEQWVFGFKENIMERLNTFLAQYMR